MANEHKRDADYVLGHSPQELERLSTQARLYEPFTMQFLVRSRWPCRTCIGPAR
jgi:hypothetical protein